MIEPLNKWEIKSTEKICAFDIDGVLNNYPESWLKFINDRNEFKITDLRVAKKLLSYETYKSLKEQYRKAGEPAEFNPAAEEVTCKLKMLGYKIIVITLRPFNKYDNLMKDTITWLDSSNIQYDRVISDTNKHIRVLTEYPFLKFMVEDHRYIANLVSSWGYRVYLLNNSYNRGYIEKNVRRIDSLRGVLSEEDKARNI